MKQKIICCLYSPLRHICQFPVFRWGNSLREHGDLPKSLVSTWQSSLPTVAASQPLGPSPPMVPRPLQWLLFETMWMRL